MQSNEEMVAALLKQGYADERVAKAMLKVDRKYFLTEEMRGSAYEDTPLPILSNQTTSAPSIIAYMLKNLDIRYGMRVLEIGTGSGYQTALAATLAGARGKVFTIERSKELYDFAKSNLNRYKFKNIIQILGNGAMGYAKKAPYDKIIYSAAARSVPKETLQQIKKNGALIAPVGTFTQELLLVKKQNGAEYQQDLGPVIFSRLEEE
ncbi:MAG: protein-L-isoaspartate(D-aspartate) O-methyltransferase [Candidatus Micrarchaeaceae archaeon]